MAMHLIIFVKPKNGLVWPVFTFLFFVSVSYLASILRSAIWNQIDVLASRTHITSVILVRWKLLLKKMKNQSFLLKYRWSTQTQYYPAHTDQLDFLNQLKINCQTNRGTPEGSESSADGYSARRIRFCFDFFSGQYLENYFEKRGQN